MMMNRFLAAGLALICATSPTLAAQWKAVPVEVRDPTRPIPVAVNLAQRELNIGADPSLGSASSPYGLVGALIVGAIESAASKKARAEIEPLLGALGEFDASVPLMAGVRAGLSGSPWLTLLSQSAYADSTAAAKDSKLDLVSGNHLAYVDCSYRIGQSFEAVYAICSVQIADKRNPVNSPGTRWKTGKLLLDRTVQSEVSLQTDTTVLPYNDCYTSERRALCRSRWMQDAGALLKQELAFALTQAGKLVGKELGLSASEIEKARKPGSASIVLAPLKTGYALEGAANVQFPGKAAGVWASLKPAVLASNSDGVVLVKSDGNLHHKRVVATPAK